MSRPISVRVVKPWLRPLDRFLTGGAEAISLWRTVYMLVDRPLSESGYKHEVDGHLLNPHQWAGHPRAFPFMYLWEQIRHGYQHSKYEIEARQIAGES
jgi:hypothetical protein